MNQPDIKTKKPLRINKFELVWYIITGFFALWGMTYVILGIVAYSLPIYSEKNLLLQANITVKRLFGLGFLEWGIIIFVISIVSAVIVLLVFARRVDREYEKKQRRTARLSRNRNIEGTNETAVNIVDAEVK